MDENIPEQVAGAQTDTSETVTFNSPEEAKQFFPVACARLKDVSHWEQVCGSNATNFALVDEKGQRVERDAGVGDYIRINIPGPGNSAGDGFDWVRVEEIMEESETDTEILAIRVRPVQAPVNDTTQVAHFFRPEATSTFIVKREGNTVSAAVHGRNEKPNTQTDHLFDKLRNALVGTASLLGLSLPQWKMLVKGLVKTV